MAGETLETIAAKLDSLALWKEVAPYNWAIKPRGVAFPYFCTVMGDLHPAVQRHLMLIEGWQTFHDFVRTRYDANFGFYTSPAEMPHFEAIYLKKDKEATQFFRYDPGYVPRNLNEAERALVAKMLWEIYGVMMRIEGDRMLTMKYATSQAMFARVEAADGTWRDEALPIPQARPHVERVTIPKAILGKVKDLPMDTGWKIVVDFRAERAEMTKEARPRYPYDLKAEDCETHAPVIHMRTCVNPETGLRGLWEGMPERFLTGLLHAGRVPGEVVMPSQRVFRMLQPLGTEIPFRLTIDEGVSVK